MSKPAQCDHEKLDVYKVSIEFVSWAGDLLDGPLAEKRQAAVRHLDRASTSIPLNIAEGNGKRSLPDRCRYFDIARGSALESAACLDVLVARKMLRKEQVEQGMALLLRVVEMLSKMAFKLWGTATVGAGRTAGFEHEHEHDYDDDGKA